MICTLPSLTWVTIPASSVTALLAGQGCKTLLLPSLLSKADKDSMLALTRFHGFQLWLQLQSIQSRLLDVGSAVATPLINSSDGKLKRTLFDESATTALEAWIDGMDEQLPALTNFILPSGACFCFDFCCNAVPWLQQALMAHCQKELFAQV